jgi:maleate isomerase
MKHSAEQELASAREMARNGVDLLVFGGVPVSFLAGYPTVEALAEALEKETGVKTTASLLCQNHALQTLGAKKVVLLRTGDGSRRDRHAETIESLGCEILDIRGVGERVYEHPLTAADTLEKARALLKDNPSADTMHCPSPHWPMTANIQTLEDEFGVNVITAGQAIVWESLRKCGVDDQIFGYGKLLREH